MIYHYYPTQRIKTLHTSPLIQQKICQNNMTSKNCPKEILHETLDYYTATNVKTIVPTYPVRLTCGCTV